MSSDTRFIYDAATAVDPLGVCSDPDFGHDFRPFAWRS